ncbi:MAG: putative membrane protein insertion efficiency factor [Pseudohongiellaceae bacterium]|jgi:putative membrane protein insertion efficiency factor
MRRLFIGLIKGYRLLISPFMARSCRFHPSCSSYAIQAIEEHGVFKGCWLALKRLLCCHPFHPGGYDPVPEKSNKQNGHTAH